MSKHEDDYPTCKETHALLRLFSDRIAPAEITAILHIDPTDAFAKGERHGKGLVRKFNGWFLSSESDVDSKDSRRHIDWLISKIQDKSAELLALQSQGVEMDISCFWLSTGQGGPILSPPQMRELARLNLDVGWEVYFTSRASETHG